MPRSLRLSLIAGLMLGGFAWTGGAPAVGAENYPEKPVILVVARSPGGASDVLARLINNELGEVLGQPAVVENRPGGAAYIAWRQLAAGTPDGYEVLLAENALAMSTALRPDEPLDPRKDFDAVAVVATSPVGVIVHSGLGIETFEELREYAKEQDGGINFSSAGVGSVSHMTLAALLHALDIEAQHIPYRGGGEANAALAGGHVQIRMTSIDASTRLADEGNAVIVAVASPKRLESLPDVPTLAELGVDVDVDLGFWWGLFVSPGTPEPIKAKIAEAARDVLEMPEVAERLAKINMVPTYADAAALEELLHREIENWRVFVEAAGLKPE